MNVPSLQLFLDMVRLEEPRVINGSDTGVRPITAGHQHTNSSLTGEKIERIQ